MIFSSICLLLLVLLLRGQIEEEVLVRGVVQSLIVIAQRP
jgi:hypothetical protein